MCQLRDLKAALSVHVDNVDEVGWVEQAASSMAPSDAQLLVLVPWCSSLPLRVGWTW